MLSSSPLKKKKKKKPFSLSILHDRNTKTYFVIWHPMPLSFSVKLLRTQITSTGCASNPPTWPNPTRCLGLVILCWWVRLEFYLFCFGLSWVWVDSFSTHLTQPNLPYIQFILLYLFISFVQFILVFFEKNMYTNLKF